MPIKTYKGKIAMDVETKIHLSTNDGLTGYRINQFKIMSSQPGVASHELVGKVRLTADPNVGPVVDFNDTDLLAAVFQQDLEVGNDVIIFDKETFNQDIFVQIGSASGSTVPANFYLELEQFKLDLNTSTYHTLKSIRSSKQIGI